MGERLRQLLRERGPRCPHGNLYGDANSPDRLYACPVTRCSCCRWMFGYLAAESQAGVPERCRACR